MGRNLPAAGPDRADSEPPSPYIFLSLFFFLTAECNLLAKAVSLFFM